MWALRLSLPLSLLYKRYINDYVQYVKSDFLAGLGFGATQQLGETTGIYMGYSVDTGRNVYLQPSLASQGVKGTVTNALASAFVGSLGGGKSFCIAANTMISYSSFFAISSDYCCKRKMFKS